MEPELYMARVWEDPVVKDGKLIDGKAVFTARNRNALNVFVRKRKNYAIQDFQLSENSGAFKFLGQFYWTALKSYEGALVLVVVENGKVKSVYDERGRQLYPFTDFLVYKNAGIVDGKRVGGDFVGGAHNVNGLKKMLKDNPDCVAERVILNSHGGFVHKSEPLWRDLKGMENEPVTVRYSGGDPVEVYYENGDELYPFNADNSGDVRCYDLVNGTKKGDVILSTKNKNEVAGLLKNNPDMIIENWNLTKEGGLRFNSEIIWHTMSGREPRETVTLVIREKKVEEVYGEQGDLIFPYSDDLNMKIYEGGRIVDGKRSGGQQVGTARTLSGVMTALEGLDGGNCIIEDFKLSSIGGCFFNRYLWQRAKGYENKRVTMLVEGNEVSGIYDKKGKKLYPFQNNLIYTGAEIVNGKRSGGELASMAMNRQSLAGVQREYPDAVITDVLLDSYGGLTWGGETYWERRQGYENANVTILKEAGELVACYGPQGELLYQFKGIIGARTFNSLLYNGDLERLITLFGEKTTVRVLFRFFDVFTPEELQSHIDRYRNSLSRRKRNNVFNGRGKNKTLREELEVFNSIELFSEIKEKDIASMVEEELIKLVYPYLVRDHRFIEEIRSQADSENISPFLRECYRNTASYYEKMIKSELKGLSRGTFLKFYQKVGALLILEKEKVILGDEAGLGKTVQVLAAAVNAYEGKGAQKVLIVCPHISKIDVWKKQIATHLRGEQSVMVISECNALDSRKKLKMAQESRFLILNYELLRGSKSGRLKERIKSLGVDFIVADEAHRIRNDSLTTRAVSEFDARYKVLVSGTPFVGRTYDKLFYLLHWLYPSKYNSLKQFRKKYCNGKMKENYPKLRSELESIMIRRYLNDVISEMPDLNIMVEPVEMGAGQMHLYREIEQKVYEDSEVPIVAQLNLLKRAAIDTALLNSLKFTDAVSGEEVICEPGSHFVVLKKTKCNVVFGENGDFNVAYNKGQLRYETRYRDKNGVFEIGPRRYKLNIVRERDNGAVEYLDFRDTRTREMSRVKYSAGKMVVNGNTLYIKVRDNDEADIRFKQGKENISVLLRDSSSRRIIDIKGGKYDIEIKRKKRMAAKYEVLDRIAEDTLGKREDKLVVFTGVRKAVDDMKERYTKKGYKVYAIHGEISGGARQRILKKFKEEETPAIFICTYQTGGESIDLIICEI